MIDILGFALKIMAPTFWAFMTGAKMAPLPAAPRPKVKLSTLPLSWADSLNQLAEL